MISPSSTSNIDQDIIHMHMASTASKHGITSVDVLCGRDKRAFNNVGNRRMRVLVSMLLPKYLAANSRQAKSLIIKELADSIRDCGGRFLKWSPSLHAYEELSDKKAHEKCSHAFRDMVSARSHGPSSSSSSNSSCESTACYNKNMASSAIQQHKKKIGATAPRTLVPFHIEYYTSTNSNNTSSDAMISEDERSIPQEKQLSPTASSFPQQQEQQQKRKRRASRMSFADTKLTFCPVDYVAVEPLSLSRAVSEGSALTQDEESFLLENESVLSDLLEDENEQAFLGDVAATADEEDGDLIKGLLLQI